jgi:hypothetical protein
MPDETPIQDDNFLADALRDRQGGGQEPPPEQEPQQDSPGQAPDSTPAQPAASTPWGDDFNAERAWSTIQTLRNENRELKSQQQRTTREGLTEKQRIQQLEDQLQQMRFDKLRSDVAVAKGLPANAVRFLDGRDQEEMERNADELLSMIGGGQTTSSAAPDFGAGARRAGTNGVSEEDFSSMIRRSAGRPV